MNAAPKLPLGGGCDTFWHPGSRISILTVRCRREPSLRSQVFEVFDRLSCSRRLCPEGHFNAKTGANYSPESGSGRGRSRRTATNRGGTACSRHCGRTSIHDRTPSCLSKVAKSKYRRSLTSRSSSKTKRAQNGTSTGRPVAGMPDHSCLWVPVKRPSAMTVASA